MNTTKERQSPQTLLAGDASQSTIQAVLPPLPGHTFKVATLNCWGLWLIGRRRESRFAAIAEHLNQARYDAVCLQEIFIESDWKRLCEACVNVLPYAYRWKSGVVGSGLAVFSRFPIERTAFHAFSLNGHAYALIHGDWMAAKGVAVARLRLPDASLLDLYCTHLHAGYGSGSQAYELHRLSQLVETRRFIEACSGDKIPFIVGADLNCEPSSELFESFAKHSALSMHLKPLKIMDSCKDPNLVTSNLGKSNAKRIDYLLYGSERLTCTSCSALENVFLSDHALLKATFHLVPTVVGHSPEFVTRQERAALKEHFNSRLGTYLKVLGTRIFALRFIALFMTLASIALFVLGIVMVMVPFGSDLGQATVISLLPLPVIIGLLTGLIAEFHLVPERKAIERLQAEWKQWIQSEDQNQTA